MKSMRQAGKGCIQRAFTDGLRSELASLSLPARYSAGTGVELHRGTKSVVQATVFACAAARKSAFDEAKYRQHRFTTLYENRGLSRRHLIPYRRALRRIHLRGQEFGQECRRSIARKLKQALCAVQNAKRRSGRLQIYLCDWHFSIAALILPRWPAALRL